MAAIIHTEQPISVTLRMSQADTQLAEDVVNLEAGFNRFEHTLQLTEEGVFTFQVDISACRRR
jgi:hypothetical protein